MIRLNIAEESRVYDTIVEDAVHGIRNLFASSRSDGSEDSNKITNKD